LSKYFDGDKLSDYEDSPITYVYGGNLEECHKVIADLEAKLAESEDKYTKMWKWEVQQINRLQEENEQLKQQLAEKEDFIEDLMTGRLKPVIPRIKEIEKQYQDKISFAVEQLENCRLNLIKLLNKKRVYLDSSTTDEMDDLFDNQIKQLKEMK
jgi:predicted RNase H-like nuclease (RuvC/YqgF family)